MIRRIMLLVLLLGCTAPTWAQNEANVYKQVSPAVVKITTSLTGAVTGESDGSGFLIDNDGHIVTNAHVASIWNVFFVWFKDGARKLAVRVGVDHQNDLAVFRATSLPSNTPVATWGDSDTVVVGTPVLAIGAPHGLDWTLTRGIVSGLNRTSLGLRGLIQTDAAVAGGSSGGPLLNQEGEVIGVIVSGVVMEDLNFAIPSNKAAVLAAEMIANPLPAPDVEPTPTPRSSNDDYGYMPQVDCHLHFIAEESVDDQTELWVREGEVFPWQLREDGSIEEGIWLPYIKNWEWDYSIEPTDYLRAEDAGMDDADRPAFWASFIGIDAGWYRIELSRVSGGEWGFPEEYNIMVIKGAINTVTYTCNNDAFDDG